MTANRRKSRIAVVGLGYVGLPLAVEFGKQYETIGFDVNPKRVAQLRRGRDLTLDSFIAAMESLKDWRDIFGGPPLSMSSTDHHASNQSFLSVVKDTRWVPVLQEPLSF